MIDKQLEDEILSSITTTGSSEQRELKINTNLEHVLTLTSGSPRLQTTCIRKSRLILSKPQSLHSLSSLQIRCALCKRVISYPCWYYEVKYAVNHFHYFICFDKDSVNKPSMKCLRH